MDPSGLGNLLVGDGGAAAIIRVNPTTRAQTVVPCGGTSVAPWNLAIAANWDIFVVDRHAVGQSASPRDELQI